MDLGDRVPGTQSTVEKGLNCGNREPVEAMSAKARTKIETNHGLVFGIGSRPYGWFGYAGQPIVQILPYLRCTVRTRNATIRFGLESYELCAYVVACVPIDVQPFEHSGCGKHIGSPRPATILALPNAPLAIRPTLTRGHQAA